MSILAIGLFLFQTQLGSVTGIVTKPGGNVPLQGAQVIVSPVNTTSTAKIRSSFSEDDGRFSISGIEPGELAIPTRNRRISGGVQGEGSDGVQLVLSPVNSNARKTFAIRSDLADKTFQFSDIVPGMYVLVASNAYGRTAIPLDVRNAICSACAFCLARTLRFPSAYASKGIRRATIRNWRRCTSM